MYLDSLSKMRVKLAVQSLSAAVAREIELNNHNDTEKTRQYIKACEQVWTVFNDNKPLDRTEDVRFQQLNEAVSFIVNWRANIEDVYGTKSEQAKHFITWQTMFDLKVIFCLAVSHMATADYIIPNSASFSR